MKPQKERAPRRLIIDCRGTAEGDLTIFGYKEFSYEELKTILSKIEALVETQKGGPR